MNNYLHYKDYVGTVSFSEEDKVYHGKVIRIKQLITFEGEDMDAITQDFHNAVDEYLSFCTTRVVPGQKATTLLKQESPKTLAVFA